MFFLMGFIIIKINEDRGIKQIRKNINSGFQIKSVAFRSEKLYNNSIM